MNKKGTTHQWWEILIIVLAIIVLVLLIFNYYGSKGLFGGVKDAAQTIWSYAPNVSLGLKALNGTSVTLPGKQSSQVSSFESTINQMLASSENNCFAKIDSPFEDLGEGTSISKEEGGGTTLIEINYNPLKQKTVFVIGTEQGLTYKTFSLDMKPCVVAGVNNESENFFNYFNRGLSELKEPYYYSLSQGLRVLYQKRRMGYSGNTGFVWDAFSGNVIKVLDFGQEPVNDESNNFENGGYLFKGKNRDICFFPTNFNVNADEDGLDNDKFTDAEDPESINYRLSHNLIKKCFT